jgi:hypothetical protein
VIWKTRGNRQGRQIVDAVAAFMGVRVRERFCC